MPLLSIKNLTYTNQDKLIIHHINLDINKGESFGLIGRSGSGKSTLLNLIIGLIETWKGEIQFLGKNIKDYPCFPYEKIQMIFQDPYGSLHPKKTIYTILREPYVIHNRLASIDDMVQSLEEIELSADYLYRYPHQLSGGQCQRIAIARALSLKPSLLLLDEPTSALDNSIQFEILSLLKKIKKEYGRTFLFVSHDLHVINHMCDRVGIIKEGQLSETLTQKSLTELLKQGINPSQII